MALKLATSADGRIATATGDSQWITGAAARAEGHRLRLRHDAILVGSGTALADDPMLTCRLPGLEDRSPVRVVLDRRLRLPLGSRLVRSAAPSRRSGCSPPATAPEAAAQLAAAGVSAVPAAETRMGRPAARMLATLAGEGITRLLVEGGAALATAFLRARTGRPDLPVRRAAADRRRRRRRCRARSACGGLGDAVRWRRVGGAAARRGPAGRAESLEPA